MLRLVVEWPHCPVSLMKEGGSEGADLIEHVCRRAEKGGIERVWGKQ